LQSGVVEGVTVSNSPITQINSNNFLGWPGKPEEQRVLFTTITTEYDYAHTMGIKILHGRDFSPDFPSDSNAILINKAALDLMNLEDPIGTELDLWGEKRTLIGVLENVLMGSPYMEVKPLFAIIDDWDGYITIRLKETNDIKASLNIVKDLFMGSTASALIEKSPVPVLSVPGNSKVTELSTIVYATAFEESDILAIEKISAFASAFNSKIKLIHVSTKKEYAAEDQMQWFKEMLKEKVAYSNISFEFRQSDDILDTLKSYLIEADADILAMLEREGNTLITNLWHFDLVKRMKLERLVPLLSFHKKTLGMS
jgi:hypothetical protein